MSTEPIVGRKPAPTSLEYLNKATSFHQLNTSNMNTISSQAKDLINLLTRVVNEQDKRIKKLEEKINDQGN